MFTQLDSGDGKTCWLSWAGESQVLSRVSSGPDNSKEQMAVCISVVGVMAHCCDLVLKSVGGCVYMLSCNYPLTTQIIALHRDPGAEYMPDAKPPPGIHFENNVL